MIDQPTQDQSPPPPRSPSGLLGRMKALLSAWVNLYPGCSACRTPPRHGGNTGPQQQATGDEPERDSHKCNANG